MTQAQGIELARDFVQAEFVDQGMIADLNVHWDIGEDGSQLFEVIFQRVIRVGTGQHMELDDDIQITCPGVGRNMRRTFRYQITWSETANQIDRVSPRPEAPDHKDSLAVFRDFGIVPFGCCGFRHNQILSNSFLKCSAMSRARPSPRKRSR